MKLRPWLVVGLALLTAGCGDDPPCGLDGGGIDQRDFEFAQSVLQKINEERATNGLQPLIWDGAAAEAAHNHLLDMCKRQYGSHYSPEGEGPPERLFRWGVVARSVGEVQFGEFTSELRVPAGAVSPLCLDPDFTHAGIASASDVQFDESCTADGFDPLTGSFDPGFCTPIVTSSKFWFTILLFEEQ